MDNDEARILQPELARNIFLTLPREILAQELAQWLRPIDLCHVGATCRDLKWFLHDNTLWGKLVVSTFGSDWQNLLTKFDLAQLEPTTLGFRFIYSLLQVPEVNVKKRSHPEQIDKRHIKKIILLGQSFAGKTSLFYRYARGTMGTFSCISPDFFTVDVSPVDTTKCSPFAPSIVHLQLWDTAGQERFRALGRYYFKDAHGCALVFDINNRSSFDEIEEWAEQVRKFSGAECQLVLVGAKSDLAPTSRQVRWVEALHLAKKLRCKYVECSAKACVDVDVVFGHLATKILQEWKEDIPEPRVDPPNFQNPPVGAFQRVYNWLASWWK
eukprot:TRINITY_DN13513_c0_g1_i1.p1 TRINITY_DN13513_c0_g1~~TRINITY_DN13513_c0_g1_i1.p1  ORF type:complete len:326 (+),score=48.95 TRINITY_DN13513_c0_g1_i1:614-1591(+)